jgi:hypothetical protein
MGQGTMESNLELNEKEIEPALDRLMSRLKLHQEVNEADNTGLNRIQAGDENLNQGIV